MLIAIFAGVAAGLGLLWFSDLPLGVQGEWTWQRFTDDAGYAEAWLFGVFVAIGVAVHVAVAGWGERRVASGKRGVAIPLGMLTATSFALLWLMGDAMPAEYGPAKNSYILYDRGAAGYFYEATQINDSAKFLAHYEEMTAGDYIPYTKKVKQRDVLHIGTHPPGLILFDRALIVLCRESPGLTDAVLATQPAAFAQAFDDLTSGRKVPPADRAALWLSVIITHLLAAATVMPLFLLARHTSDAGSAWRAAAFWSLVPALAIFLPKSDALLPFFATLFLWLWLSALRKQSILRAALSGLVMLVGLTTSLALLPVALLAVLLTLWETLVAEDADIEWKPAAWLAGVSIGTFLAAAGLLYWHYNAFLPAIWLENYRNHAGFYEGRPRSWGTWLLINAIELTLAVGWPAMLLACVAFFTVIRSPEQRWTRDAGVLWCSACAIGLLWLSGKNMGEAGRLWLFLMPWILWMSATAWKRIATGERVWLIILIVQAIVCWLTAMRVKVFFLL